jgi:hypothetical protein
MGLIFLAGLAATAAFAADVELPSTCGDAGTELCVDADSDGFYANAKESAAKDCQDDLEENQFAGIIHPGAPIAIGDADADGSGGDSNCDGTDDDAELEEALQAAAKLADPKDENSPKAQAAAEKLADLIGECVNDGDYAGEAGPFVWSMENGRYGCHNLPEGWGYSRSTGVQSRADRAALGAAQAAQKSAAAVQAELGHPAIPASEGVPAQPATGLYAALASVEQAMLDADAATRAELEAAKTEILKKITDLEARLTGFGNRLTRAEAGIRNLRGTGVVLEGGLYGGVVAGRPLYEYEGGPQVRSGVAAVGQITATIGSAWPGHLLYLDLGFAPFGSEKQGSERLPYTLGSAAFGHQWVKGSLAVGPQLVAVTGGMGNPMTPTVSEWGGGAGLKLSLLFPLENRNVRVGFHCGLNGIVESFGTNDVWDAGPGLYATCGLAGGYGPQR